MTRAVRVAAAASIAAAAVVVVLDRSAAPRRTAPPLGAIVSAPVAPTAEERAVRAPTAVAVARRGIHWQLAAEAGRPLRVPGRTFTDRLAAELAGRPPRPAPSSPRAHLVRVSEQTPIGGLRRVLTTVRRGSRVEHITLLVLCRPDCRVASIE